MLRLKSGFKTPEQVSYGWKSSGLPQVLRSAPRIWFTGVCLTVLLFTPSRSAPSFAAGKAFRAGAAMVDITPTHFPAIVSGSFLQRTANKVQDPLHARSLVLDDGANRIAIVIVDNLMMPRSVVDDAKQRAEKATGIPTSRMLVSATHTHAAPSVGGALGTGVDENYVTRLPAWIAEAVEAAVGNLAPAKVGWALACDSQHTNCRRWILRPDRIGTDPFGRRTIRAMMHPGYQNPNYVGPAGPEDPYLTVFSVKTPQDRPVALLANYSMHYFGSAAVSADYYGRFCTKLAELIGAESLQPPFVAVMSQGTSGDLHWMDYSQPRKSISIDQYAQEVAEVAYGAYETIKYHDWVPVAMAERKLTLRRRVPDEERLAWARKIAAEMKGHIPQNRPEVYALEQIYLRENPVRELKLQAIRVGDLGITAIPCEVYGITGLKIKAQSPLQPTMNFELANGSEGYIPPPEQHTLGGYTTWPARSAGLEVEAEPRIVETVLELLEEVAGAKRRSVTETKGPYAEAVLASKPVAYWRLGEFAGRRAVDCTDGKHDGIYEDGVALFLDGLPEPGLRGVLAHRAAHFAGGRMKAGVQGLSETYSIEMWFHSGMPSDARPVTGYLFSRGPDGARDAPGDHLGIGGTAGNAGKLFFYNGDTRRDVLAGTADIPMRSWNHVVFVRNGKSIRVYLNGNSDAEICGEVALNPEGTEAIFIGGRSDNLFNFEGKIDEAALYDRALSSEEMTAHYRAAQLAPTAN